jgi:hypothetical protein
MFANPLWSVAILIALVLIYRFIISPRLRVRFADTYSHIDSFWGRLWARIYAFRSPVIGAIGALAVALPDLLVKIAPLDFSTILPQPWGLYVGTAVGIIIPIMKAFETKADPKAA